MITESTEIEIYKSKLGLLHIQFKNIGVGTVESAYFKMAIKFIGQVPTVTFKFDIRLNLKSRYSPEQIMDTKKVIEDWDKIEYLQMSGEMSQKLRIQLSTINNYEQGKTYMEFVIGDNEIKKHLVDVHLNDNDVKFMNLDKKIQ